MFQYNYFVWFEKWLQISNVRINIHEKKGPREKEEVLSLTSLEHWMMLSLMIVSDPSPTEIVLRWVTCSYMNLFPFLWLDKVSSVSSLLWMTSYLSWIFANSYANGALSNSITTLPAGASLSSKRSSSERALGKKAPLSLRISGSNGSYVCSDKHHWAYSLWQHLISSYPQHCNWSSKGQQTEYLLWTCSPSHSQSRKGPHRA